jgi:hypothetical protein
VTVDIYRGSSTADDPVETLTTTRSAIDGSWSVSASPALEEGSYIAFASQEDAAANVAYSNGRSFTVDTTGPQVTLTAPPSLTNDRTPALAGKAGSAPGDGGTITVKVYAGSSTSGSPLQTLTTPRSGGSWTVDAAILADGTYTATAEQTDAAGNTTTTSGRQFKVDASAPDTTITSGPSGSVTARTASFRFTGSEAGAKLECRLDGAAWATCPSPKSYSNLKLGSHTFQARATDAAGNVDATPATRTWKVVAPVTKPTTTTVTPPATVLTLTLKAPKRQKKLRRGRLTLFATCNIACTLRLRPGLKLLPKRHGGRTTRLKLRKKSVQLLAGKRTRLNLKLSKRLRRKVLRALSQRRKVKLTIRAKAVDAKTASSKRVTLSVRR